MQRFLALLFLLVCTLTIKAQNKHLLNGSVRENPQTPVIGAGVILTYGKDTLKAVTDTAGKFTFNQVKSTKFRITVRSIGYISVTKDYDLPESKAFSLDPVTLKEESQTLQDVVIKGKIIPVRIKEDTLEYNAAAYPTRPKDRVSELIKQLPGVTIDKDGNVKSLGKTLTKIRVNGKDFFTGDVKEFINKLPADLIAKVQMIDDYGDEANFTGVKTGTPAKILNLVTKDGKNSGIFGSAQASLGTNKQYSGEGGANYWKDEKQASVFGNISTQDNGAGSSNSQSAGLTYNNKLGKGLTGLFSYAYNKSSNDSKTLSSVETVNSLGTIYNQSSNESSGGNQDQRLNGTIFKKSKKDFLTANFMAALSDNDNTGFSQSLQTGIIKQDLNTNNDTKGRNPNLNFSGTYSRKLAKPGRIITATMSASSRMDISDENLSDRIVYYDKVTGNPAKDSVLNRLLDTKNRTNDFKGEIKYEEPLGRQPDSIVKRSLDLGYAFNVNGTNNHLLTFAGATDRLLLVDSLSNAYTTSFITHSLNLMYRFSNKRWRYSLGLIPRMSVLNGKYENLGEGIDQTTFNISPVANFNYNIANKHFFDFNLSQNTTPPAFDQLQPVPETRNLQNIIIGNPDLKPSVNQSANLNYRSVNISDGSMLQVGVNGSLMQNKVVTNTVLLPDTLGLRQETRYENADGDYNISSQYSFSKPLMNNKYNLELSGTLGYSNNVFFSENVKGLNKALNLSEGLTMRMNQKWISMNANANYSFSTNSYTVGYGNTGDIQTWQFNTDAKIIFAKSLNAGFEVYKTVNTGYALTSSNPLLINMNLEKFFFSKRASIKLSAFDLLAQGNNQQRIISGNTTTDFRTNQITRYFLMRFNMTLDQFGLGRS